LETGKDNQTSCTERGGGEEKKMKEGRKGENQVLAKGAITKGYQGKSKKRGRGIG